MKLRYSTGTALLLAAMLSACAAPALTPERVGQLAYAALGPEMQMGEQLTLVWVQAPGAAAQPVANPEAEAARSPLVPELASALARGSREPINLAVGGPDSAFAAQVLLQALRAVPQPVLPGLRIAFVGQRADIAQLAPIMAAKRAALHFEPQAD
ncbi:MAG: hypothetical protein EOO29_41805 [Comamonadaceae bacterium]|nr:MAG: hypothetical protein EOO29_41805 [Comamonadaceae bacterium]